MILATQQVMVMQRCSEKAALENKPSPLPVTDNSLHGKLIFFVSVSHLKRQQRLKWVMILHAWIRMCAQFEWNPDLGELLGNSIPAAPGWVFLATFKTDTLALQEENDEVLVLT